MATRTHIAKVTEGVTEKAVQMVPSDPGSPVDSQIWINTSSREIKYFDGTVVHNLIESDGLERVDQPLGVSPIDGATGIQLSATLTASDFIPAYDLNTHASSTWEVRDAADNLVFSSIDDAANLTSILATGLLGNVTYKWRVQYKDIKGYTSAFSEYIEFSTIPVYIETPSITYPTTSPDLTDVDFGTDFTTSTFNVFGASNNHISTRWQIALSSNPTFDVLVFDSLDDPTNLESITLDSDDFEVSTEYILRVKHTDSNYGDSAWSAVRTFTTAAQFDIVPLLAVAHQSAPYITVYDQDIDTFTKLADPASLPASTSYSCSFSSDDTYLAVAHDNYPYLTIYKRSGDTFTKLANPANMPSNRVFGISFTKTGFPQS